jgi:hypothetical protein
LTSGFAQVSFFFQKERACMKHVLYVVAIASFVMAARDVQAQQFAPVIKVVPSGGSVRVDHFGSLDPTCRSIGPVAVNVTKPPRFGQVLTQIGPEYPDYPTANSRSRCNTRKRPSTRVFYHSVPGYFGTDDFAVEVISPTGTLGRRHYMISVR